MFGAASSPDCVQASPSGKQAPTSIHAPPTEWIQVHDLAPETAPPAELPATSGSKLAEVATPAKEGQALKSAQDALKGGWPACVAVVAEQRPCRSC